MGRRRAQPLGLVFRLANRESRLFFPRNLQQLWLQFDRLRVGGRQEKSAALERILHDNAIAVRFFPARSNRDLEDAGFRIDFARDGRRTSPPSQFEIITHVDCDVLEQGGIGFARRVGHPQVGQPGHAAGGIGPRRQHKIG